MGISSALWERTLGLSDLMMLAVMQIERLLAHPVRGERGFGVGKGGQLEGHGDFLGSVGENSRSVRSDDACRDADRASPRSSRSGRARIWRREGRAARRPWGFPRLCGRELSVCPI